MLTRDAVATLSLTLSFAACTVAPAAPDRGPLGKADALDGSCSLADRDVCDGQSDGACYCDDACESFGDCCFDYVETCTAPGDPRPTLFITEELHAPESVAFDEKTKTYFVTNLAVNILEADPNNPPDVGVGYVSQYDQWGALVNASFATELQSPKGIVVLGGIVYVADPKAIIALDAETGYELARYDAEESGGFNDLAIDPEDNTIYVTDTALQSIYQLDPSAAPALRLVAKDPGFEFPNGLFVSGASLVMGSTGILPSAAGPGTLGKIFLIDKKSGATKVLAEAEGRWDGIVALADGTIVANDFSTGDVFRIDREAGAKTLLFKTEVDSEFAFAGVADMNLSGTTLLIPSMFTNEVYRHTPSL